MVVCFGLLRRCSGLKGNPWTKRKVLCMIKPNMVQRPVQQQKLEPALRRLTYPAEDGFGRGHGGQNRGSFFLSDFSILFSYLTCESRF